MDAPFNVEVIYRKPIKGGHMLKIYIPAFEWYIDGWRLVPSDRNLSGWWFQSPARPYGRKLIPMIEHANGKFWQWLEAEAIRVVEANAGAEVQAAPKTAPPTKASLDEVYDMPPDDVVNDEATFNQYLSENIDQTLPGIDVEPTKQPPVDPWSPR